LADVAWVRAQAQAQAQAQVEAQAQTWMTTAKMATMTRQTTWMRIASPGRGSGARAFSPRAAQVQVRGQARRAQI
jgi:hypothetical protein